MLQCQRAFCAVFFSALHFLLGNSRVWGCAFVRSFLAFSFVVRRFLAECVNSSLSGIRWNLGEFGEISGKFRGTQWNSVGFCMALSMGNSWGISGQTLIFGKIGGWGWFRMIWGVKRLSRK